MCGIYSVLVPCLVGSLVNVVGRGAGVSQLCGLNSRSLYLIHCIPRSTCADKTRSYPSKYASRQFLLCVFTQSSVDI